LHSGYAGDADGNAAGDGAGNGEGEAAAGKWPRSTQTINNNRKTNSESMIHKSLEKKQCKGLERMMR
jgi:hypothetical protein